MGIVVGFAIGAFVLAWYAPNAGRVVAVAAIPFGLAILLGASQPTSHTSTDVPLAPSLAFLGVIVATFVVAHVAARRRRARATTLAPATVVRR